MLIPYSQLTRTSCAPSWCPDFHFDIIKDPVDNTDDSFLDATVAFSTSGDCRNVCSTFSLDDELVAATLVRDGTSGSDSDSSDASAAAEQMPAVTAEHVPLVALPLAQQRLSQLPVNLCHFSMHVETPFPRA